MSNQKHWRPGGWENPYPNITIRVKPRKHFDIDAWNEQVMREVAKQNYEAGADAMLEILREKGLHLDGKYSVGVKLTSGSGTIAEIPDDPE